MKYDISILSKEFLILTAIFIVGNCSDSENIEEGEWQLVWEDNFEGPAGQPTNTAKWDFQIGNGTNYGLPPGWDNNELQFFTDNTGNIALDGSGNLAIVARKENVGGASYTSSRILTQGLFDQANGRFEARMKLPWGQGLWPAFWLLGANIETVGWPQCGEIDNMEYRGQEPNIVHGSVHGAGYSAGNSVTKSYTLANGRFDSEFHEFAIEWGQEFIDFYVDNIHYQRITPDDVNGEWVYDHPFYILINVAVGGGFVGPPSNETIFPQTMLVDWVRVYSKLN